MKKFISLIALVGIIAACTPERIDTAFKLAGAKVTVNVEVVDLINGGKYAGSYDVTSTFGTVSSDKATITYQAPEDQPISAGDYTVTVTGPKLAKDYSAKFAVPAILAGGEAMIHVVVPVGEPINGWEPDYDYDFDNKTEGETIYFLKNESGYDKYAYSHKGIDEWYYNNSEYRLEGVALYSYSYYLHTPLNIVRYDYLGFEGILDNMLETFTNDSLFENIPYEFTVSAWAMWNVVQTNYWMKIPFEVFVTKGTEKITLGTFDLEEVNTVSVQKYELPYPLAPGHAHYEEGHGHDAHGSMPNAGGGISYNE